MTPNWRRSILPRRDGPTVPIADVRDDAVAAIRDALGRTTDIGRMLSYRGLVDGYGAAGQRFLAERNDPQGAGVVTGLTRAPGAEPADWADFWIAEHGFGFAALIVMRSPHWLYSSWSSADFPGAGPRPVDRLGLAHRLRARLTQISVDDYTAVMRAIAPARDTRLAKTAAAFMFPTNQDWVTDACRSPIGLNEGRSRLELLTSVASVDDLWPLLSPPGVAQHQDYRHILPTLVDRFGDGLVPVLNRVLGEYVSKERSGAVAEALACLPGDAAFETLLEFAAREGVRPGLTRAMRNFPQRAQRLLAGRDDAVARELRGAPPVPAQSRSGLPELLADPPWQRAKPKALPRPASGISAPAPVLAWRDDELTSARQYAPHPRTTPDWEGIEGRYAQTGEWIRFDDVLAHGPDRLGEKLIASGWTPKLRYYYYAAGQFRKALLRWGPQLDYFMLAFVENGGDSSQTDFLGPIRSALVATKVAEWLAGTRRSLIAIARAYLHRHGAAIAPYLLPALAGVDAAGRDAAQGALRYLARHDSAEAVIDVVGRHDPDAAPVVAEILAVDPLLILPKRVPRVPDWARPALTTPVRLADGTELPVDVVETIAVMFMMSGPVLPYAGITQLAELCDVRSLDQLAWALFDAWWAYGAPAAHKWALDGLAWFADDDSVDRIADMVKSWPGQGRGGRIPHGLDVLSTVGTDHALLTLFRMSKKGRSKPLKDKAAERLAEIAVARGLTSEQMADRLVPDLGLDDASATTFDYGPRSFTVEFDELLQLVVRDQNGARLRSFPKPGVRDDTALAPESHRRFTRLKREIRAVAKEQLPRLEVAMIHERRWSVPEFEMLMVAHPVLVQLARRLVWGQFDDAGALIGTFRIAEDRSYADVEDDAVALDADRPIGIVHPLHGGLTGWAEVFTDYEILQPFPQISREIVEATPADLEGSRLTRFDDAAAQTFALLGLRSRGWVLGEAFDGPERRDLGCAAPRGRWVHLWMDPGIPFDPREIDTQHIHVEVSTGTFAELGTIFTAEVVTAVASTLS